MGLDFSHFSRYILKLKCGVLISHGRSSPVSILSSLIFAALAVAAFGFFALNLKKVWVRIHAGTGPDDARTENPALRLVGMIRGGFLQEKMLKDFWPAVMHFLIFYGFVFVTIGTVETLVHGI